MPWDKDSAVAYARQHASALSGGNCAKAVRLAIASGGIELLHTHYAKDYGASLTHSGFYVTGASTPVAGDVVVIQPMPGHPDGHMAIYDGHIWISDFKQYHGFYPGESYRHIKPPYKIYRHP